MGTVFPLFTHQLYARLTYHWGTTLFACIAVAMIPIPLVRCCRRPMRPFTDNICYVGREGAFLERPGYPCEEQVCFASDAQAMRQLISNASRAVLALYIVAYANCILLVINT